MSPPVIVRLNWDKAEQGEAVERAGKQWLFFQFFSLFVKHGDLCVCLKTNSISVDVVL
jgi:hypothetical protein